MKFRKSVALWLCVIGLLFSATVCQAKEVPYTVDGTVITIKMEEGDRFVSVVKDAIEYANTVSTASQIYTVKIPAGTYDLDGTIHVYGNIKLDLTGVTINYTITEGNMLMLGDVTVNTDKKIMGGYGTYANITVIGGLWKGNKDNTSSLVRMAHGKNITFDGCVFDGGGCAHQMEIASINGFYVKNCTFKNMPGNGTDEKQEALQLDVPCSEYVFGGTVLDGTPMKNVEVTGCTFSNVPRGVGTHSMLVGYYHDNVKITDNIFENVAGECVIALNFINCTISGNKINNCGAGILFQTFKKDVKAVYNTIYNGDKKVSKELVRDTNSVITDNIITIVESDGDDEAVGIKVYGFDLKKNTAATGKGSTDVIEKNNYYAQNVTVTNNTITTCGHGIHLLDTYDSLVSGNTVTCTGPEHKDGIFVEFASKRITITNNVVSALRYGIFLQNKSTAKKIENNNVIAAGDYAIGLYDGSKVTGAINKNTVSNCNTNAIFINRNSSAKNITNNVITNPGNRGIFVYSNSTITGKISGNTVTGAKTEGININSTKNSFTIADNTVSKCGSWPLLIKTPTTKTITVENNTLTSKKSKTVIQVSGGNVVIKNNTLKNGKWAVCMNNGTKGTIGYNNMSKNAKNVYMILGNKKVGKSTVNAKALNISSIKGGKKSFTVNCKKAKKGFVIEYATKEDFSDAKTVVLKSGKKATVSKLKSKRTYYVRVASSTNVNGITVYSKYGKVKQVTTK